VSAIEPYLRCYSGSRQCEKPDKRKWLVANAGKAARRRSMNEPNLTTNTRQANWRRQNGEKYQAHLAVQRALSNEELARGVCEVCGSPDVDAHHDDYSRPLEVRWLCRQHHAR